MPFIISILILVSIILLIAFFATLCYEKNDKNSVFSGLDSVLFLIMMPKQEFKKEGETPKEEKAIIFQMEQVLTNFLNLKQPSFFGEKPSIALEIASQTGGSDISFYISVPKYLETSLEKYVQGIYPKAVVKKVPQDYTVFEPKGYTSAAYLKLKGNPLFPISTYQKLEKDPLSQITNNLSKIAADEGAALQLIIRPIPNSKITKNPFVEIISEIFKPAKKQDPESLKREQKKEKHFDQSGYDTIQSKIQKQLFETNIRVIASAHTLDRAEEILGHLTGSFNQFSLFGTNSLNPKKISKNQIKKFVYDFSFRVFNEGQGNILNVEELASIYHFPTQFTETPYIQSAKTTEIAPPIDLPNEGVNLIGRVNFRGEEKKVHFASREDRRRHFYVIGQTGTGKSTLLREMIRQDIENGEGVAVIDPH